MLHTTNPKDQISLEATFDNIFFAALDFSFNSEKPKVWLYKIKTEVKCNPPIGQWLLMANNDFEGSKRQFFAILYFLTSRFRRFTALVLSAQPTKLSGALRFF